MIEILLLQGIQFSMFAVVLDNDYCPAMNFLEMLKKNDITSYKTFLNLLKLHADCGPVRNERKSKKIEGYNNLFEFKTDHGDRLVYFYCSGRKTIVTDGFHKGRDKGNQLEYKKSKRLRDRYFEEVDNV